MSVDREMIETWLTGWTRARHVPAPVNMGDCWRVDLGWAHQKERYVFAQPSPQLPRLAQTITDPLVYLKAFITADDLRLLLPSGWVIEPQCAMMLLDDLTTTIPARRDGYRLETDGRNARVFAGDAVVAEGQVVMQNGLAVFVGIKVDPAYRRRGLGRAVVGALTVLAQDLGARHGALVATREGQTLYRALGWRDYAPYVSAFPNIQR